MAERYTKATLVTGPTIEPVSVDDARLQCRLGDNHEEDEYLAALITAARVHVENITWRALISQTWDFSYDTFDVLKIPKPPLSSVTSVKYYDGNSTEQTLASTVYETGEINGIGVVRLKYNQTWPPTQGHDDDITVRAVCGYGTTAASVPANYRHAIKLLVAHWFVHREEVVTGMNAATLPSAVDALLSADRAFEY